MSRYPVIVIGAGPAGLTAAHKLAKHQILPMVVEQSRQVGGIARTAIYKGYRFDIGGHRFFTKLGPVQQFWEEILGSDFIKVARLSRIYYNGKFFNYPLSPFDALSKLGLTESFLIIGSYLKAQLRSKLSPDAKRETFEDWVSDRFGGRLFQTFFKTYTEKVWGISCKELQADWAAQRIKGLSLTKAIMDALFSGQGPKTLIKSFHYPRLGPGMLWERCQSVIEDMGGQVNLETSVICLKHQNNRIEQVITQEADKLVTLSADHYISSMPVTALVKRLEPPAPTAVLEAANALRYRDFIIVSLIIDKADLFPDNWIYVHSPEVKVGRIQNFKNWSIEMVPDKSKTCLGMEYFCSESDDIWQSSDAELVALATQELAQLGLAKGGTVEDSIVLRQRKAYPIYDEDYRKHVTTIQTYLATFENLQTIGRNGMHHYNNQDHSMMTGLLAAKNILGNSYNLYDLWQVNTEESYHEEIDKADKTMEKQTEVFSGKQYTSYASKTVTF